jgi:hypothetical protein
MSHLQQTNAAVQAREQQHTPPTQALSFVDRRRGQGDTKLKPKMTQFGLWCCDEMIGQTATKKQKKIAPLVLTLYVSDLPDQNGELFFLSWRGAKVPYKKPCC